MFADASRWISKFRSLNPRPRRESKRIQKGTHRACLSSFAEEIFLLFVDYSALLLTLPRPMYSGEFFQTFLADRQIVVQSSADLTPQILARKQGVFEPSNKFVSTRISKFNRESSSLEGIVDKTYFSHLRYFYLHNCKMNRTSWIPKSSREIRNSEKLDSVEIRLSIPSLPIIRESAREGSRAKDLFIAFHIHAKRSNLQFRVAIEIDIRLPLSRVSLDILSERIGRKRESKDSGETRWDSSVAKPRRSKHVIMPPGGRLISPWHERVSTFPRKRSVDDLLPAFTAIFFFGSADVSSDPFASQIRTPVSIHGHRMFLNTFRTRVPRANRKFVQIALYEIWET